MLKLKLSVFIVSLIAAAVVGGVASGIVINVFYKPASCESTLENLLRREEALQKQRRSAPIIQSGNDKEY